MTFRIRLCNLLPIRVRHGVEMNDEAQLYQRYGRDCPPGTVLFHEGEPGAEMFVIHSGRVQISRAAREVEKILAVLGPGEFFGEMAIISNRPRTATAVVLEEARLLAIDGKTFEAMVRGNAEIAVRLIRKFAERLAAADSQIENLLLRDGPSRLVHHLLTQVDEVEENGSDEVVLDVSISRLPSILGVSPSLVDDLLARLVKAGICVLGTGTLLVKDPVQLREYFDYLSMKEKFRELG